MFVSTRNLSLSFLWEISFDVISLGSVSVISPGQTVSFPLDMFASFLCAYCEGHFYGTC